MKDRETVLKEVDLVIDAIPLYSEINSVWLNTDYYEILNLEKYRGYKLEHHRLVSKEKIYAIKNVTPYYNER
jgi:hypothetical protein